MKGTVFFTADDGIHGRQLWRSEGTRASTALVKEIVPDRYRYYGSHYDLTALGGTLFFTVKDGVHGRELWKSDGTRSGTVLVKDINPDDQQFGGGPRSLTAVGRTLFFTARDGTHGQELWKSDGTRSGTVLVKDITPGNSYYYGYPHRPNSYRHHSLTAVGNTLFFTARDDAHGQELWKSDGTRKGTVLVKDIYPGRSSSGYYGPYSLTEARGKLFFSATDGVHGEELWKSDGTRSGTVPVQHRGQGGAGGYPGEIADVGGRVFFSADSSRGRELWKSDGSSAGTVQVKDIWPGDIGSFPGFLTGAADILFFTADDGAHGDELWKSDGTRKGTVLVKDIRPGPGGYSGASSYPSYLTGVGGAVFFTAEDGVHGNLLWRSDGSRVGTVRVKAPCAANGYPYAVRGLTGVGTRLFFSASDRVHGEELWKTDGTRAGTVMVKDINTRPSGPSSRGTGRSGSTS